MIPFTAVSKVENMDIFPIDRANILLARAGLKSASYICRSASPQTGAYVLGKYVLDKAYVGNILQVLGELDLPWADPIFFAGRVRAQDGSEKGAETVNIGYAQDAASLERLQQAEKIVNTRDCEYETGIALGFSPINVEFFSGRRYASGKPHELTAEERRIMRFLSYSTELRSPEAVFESLELGRKYEQFIAQVSPKLHHQISTELL